MIQLHTAGGNHRATAGKSSAFSRIFAFVAAIALVFPGVVAVQSHKPVQAAAAYDYRAFSTWSYDSNSIYVRNINNPNEIYEGFCFNHDAEQTSRFLEHPDWYAGQEDRFDYRRLDIVNGATLNSYMSDKSLLKVTDNDPAKLAQLYERFQKVLYYAQYLPSSDGSRQIPDAPLMYNGYKVSDLIWAMTNSANGRQENPPMWAVLDELFQKPVPPGNFQLFFFEAKYWSNDGQGVQNVISGQFVPNTPVPNENPSMGTVVKDNFTSSTGAPAVDAFGKVVNDSLTPRVNETLVNRPITSAQAQNVISDVVALNNFNKNQSYDLYTWLVDKETGAIAGGVKKSEIQANSQELIDGQVTVDLVLDRDWVQQQLDAAVAQQAPISKHYVVFEAAYAAGTSVTTDSNGIPTSPSYAEHKELGSLDQTVWLTFYGGPTIHTNAWSEQDSKTVYIKDGKAVVFDEISFANLNDGSYTFETSAFINGKNNLPKR
ncbi:VaFE repeat-containing surface-anchored protein [Corynebacterium epidermidicanis]|uniref:T-Q ester bond containing domain-containing protein n=1 Tax=Corynebacterium epidermidicanis TaxID=1050174 RepID=A0A0G3GMH5_9CORY|nr:VaFE repeat-containing surface-anchored protein [Corynebacterium epidermidicanis]AKK02344.1 hypothetical protein CEPID_02315 [Corynebacterium epidermidicanis]